jgi:hypothetical protein
LEKNLAVVDPVPHEQRSPCFSEGVSVKDDLEEDLSFEFEKCSFEVAPSDEFEPEENGEDPLLRPLTKRKAQREATEECAVQGCNRKFSSHVSMMRHVAFTHNAEKTVGHVGSRPCRGAAKISVDVFIY